MQPLSFNVVFKFNAHSIGMLVLAAMLAACASKQQQEKIQPTENPPAKNQAGQAPATPELRADFDSAMALIKSGEYSKAIILLKQVTERSPGNAVPCVNLAMAYGKTGDLKLAEEYFRRALEMDPGNAVASNEYAILQRKAGKFSEARQVYEKALERYPDYHLARRNFGILCDLYLRDYGCALKQYQIYSDAVPQDKVAKIWIADVQNKLGR